MQINEQKNNIYSFNINPKDVKMVGLKYPYYKICNQPNDTFLNSKTNSKSIIRSEFEKIKNQQGLIGKVWDGFKNLVGMKSGSNQIEKIIKSAEKGEISEEEAQKSIEKYKEGQNLCVDVVADLASGILSVGAFSLSVGGALFTGGASLAAGLAIAAATGAGVKIGIKASDAKATEKEYGAKNLLYDTLTGGVNGLLAPVTNGLGNCVTKTIGQKLGLKIVQEGAEEAAEQVIKHGIKESVKSAILNQSIDVVGDNMAKKAMALGMGMAVDGALGGSSDNMLRAALNGEDVLKAGVQGAIGGAIMAPVIGSGFRIAGKAGKSINNKITTKIVLPDGVNTKFKQGRVGDCALLSTIDAMMNNPSTSKVIKKSITKTIGGDYNVKIGNKVVKVSKNAISDEMLSDITGIKIFEQAYKQLTGNLDGGFSDEVAKHFGLTPVHITNDAITDEVLNKIAKEKGSSALSLGTLVDGEGKININGGQRHYFTIRDIDSENRILTLTSPLDTSKEIKISYEDVKNCAVSIDGGTVKSIDLPNSMRNPGDVKFRASTLQISDMCESIMDCDGSGELDEEVVRRVLSSIYPDQKVADTTAFDKIQKLITSYSDDIDQYLYEDAENLNSVLEFIGKTHKLIGPENLDDYRIEQVMNTIMDGEEILVSDNIDLFNQLGDLLEKPLSNLDKDTRVDLFFQILKHIEGESIDNNIESMISQLKRLGVNFSDDKLSKTLVEIYKNGVPESEVQKKFDEYTISSKVFAYLKPENVDEDYFNSLFSSVIKELKDRGYDEEEIATLIRYSYMAFMDRQFINCANTTLFADTIEEMQRISDTSVITEYTTGSEPFNDILTVPVENLEDLPKPKQSVSDGKYSFSDSLSKIRELDLCLKNIKTKRDMTVYRGEGYEVLNAYKLSDGELLGNAINNAMKANDENRINEIIADILGAEITQPHFMSTAYTESGARVFVKHGGGVLWSIDAPKGSNGLYIDPFNSVNGKESEILFGRNTKLLIKDAKLEDDIFQIYAEIVS